MAISLARLTLSNVTKFTCFQYHFQSCITTGFFDRSYFIKNKIVFTLHEIFPG